MLNGLWSAKFFIPPSSTDVFDAGVIVFYSGSINGGDSSYYYKGFYRVQGQQFLADISIMHYSGDYNQIFGQGVDQTVVTVTGETGQNEFEVLGTAPFTKQAIGLKLQRLSDI